MDKSFENGHYLHTDAELGEEEVDETKKSEKERDKKYTHILHAFKVFLLF